MWMSNVSRAKQVMFSLVAVVLAIVIFTVTAELLTRLYLGKEPENAGRLLKNKDVRIGFSGNSGETSVLIENNRPVVKGVKVNINNVGLRDKKDRSFEKAEGTLRIALFGDSFTFGHGVEDDETLSYQLETILSEKAVLSENVEVLNFGVQGFNTVQEYIYLSRFGSRFSPDVIILVWLYNDFHRRGYALEDLAELTIGQSLDPKVGESRSEQRRQVARTKSSVTAWLRERSDFYNYIVAPRLKYLIAAQIGLDGISSDANYTDFSQPGAQLSLKAIEYAADFCGARGIRFGVVVFPAIQALGIDYYQENIYQKIAMFCIKNRIPVLNLFEVFAGQDASELVISRRDAHPNGEALRMAALAISEWPLLQSRSR